MAQRGRLSYRKIVRRSSGVARSRTSCRNTPPGDRRLLPSLSHMPPLLSIVSASTRISTGAPPQDLKARANRTWQGSAGPGNAPGRDPSAHRGPSPSV